MTLPTLTEEQCGCRECPCCPLHYNRTSDERKKIANDFGRGECGCGSEEYEPGDDLIPKCDRCAWIAVGYYGAMWPEEL